MVAVMKEVAVLGAGSAGLVTSRHLARVGIRPTIFEASNVIGGAWNGNKNADDDGDDDGAANHHVIPNIWNHLTTNLSRYTCCFSDHPWSRGGSVFPGRQDMLEYLQSYSSRYVDPACFRFGCEVRHVKRQEHNHRYRVEWKDNNSGEENNCRVEEFDGVVVATGFFSTMEMPRGLADDITVKTKHSDDDDNTADDRGRRRRQVIHSAQYRSPEEFKDQTVAIIGSSFSAVEIAADIAPHSSRVVHVLPTVPYVVPRYLPVTTTIASDEEEEGEKKSRCLPIDMAFYQRQDDQPKREYVSMDAEDCRKRHSALRSLLGPRQKHTVLGYPENMDEPPSVAISDHYLSWLIQERIDVVRGRLKDIEAPGGRGPLRLHLEGVNQASVVPDGVDRVICCTGYYPSLEKILDRGILDTLQYRTRDGFEPMELCYETFHPKLHGLAFVGMYRAPYLGVMELQARLAASMFTGHEPSEGFVRRGLLDSQTIRQQRPRPQFPRFDYVGLMDAIATELTLPSLPIPAVVDRDDKDNRAEEKDDPYLLESKRMVTPAFYQRDQDAVRDALDGVDDEVRTSDKNVPHVVLGGLIGKWTFQRTIEHFHDGRVCRVDSITGVITFSLQDDGITVLYREDGKFRIPDGGGGGGAVMDVFREYEYVHNQVDGTMDVYFVEGGKRAHLFLSLKFTNDPQRRQGNMGDDDDKTHHHHWHATSDHLCIRDLYKGSFDIQMDGIAARAVTMTYRVKGPEKNYEATTHCQPIL